MAVAHDGYMYGLSIFKFGEAEIGCISDDSIDWGGDEKQTTKIWAAQKRQAPVKEITDNNGTNELTFDLIELKPDNLKMVMGGTVAGGKWSAPAAEVNLENPVEITTADGTVISVKKASLVAKPKGKLGYKDVFKINCKLTFLMPDDGTAPYDITYPVAGA